jgi:hypothetical protein
MLSPFEQFSVSRCVMVYPEGHGYSWFYDEAPSLDLAATLDRCFKRIKTNHNSLAHKNRASPAALIAMYRHSEMKTPAYLYWALQCVADYFKMSIADYCSTLHSSPWKLIEKLPGNFRLKPINFMIPEHVEVAENTGKEILKKKSGYGLRFLGETKYSIYYT